MTMFTNCTHCGATFRVTLEQLQSSSGQVRCGVCDHVFDAFVALSANDPVSDSTPMATEEVDLSPVPIEVELIAASENMPQALDLDVSVRAPGSSVDEPVSMVDVTSAQPQPASGADEARRLSVDSFPASRTVAKTSATAIALAALLAIALVLQCAYFFRAEIAASWPDTRSTLEAACAPFGCDVPLPRLSDRLTIEASDLQALDPTRPNRVVLSATIRNRASLTQAWPMLELTLTNTRDQVAARKVFTPDEYLDGGNGDRGIAANAEAGIRLRLDTGDIVPAGYRIYLFHP
jgi:predicted Zn finger-like uncharacterized protein